MTGVLTPPLALDYLLELSPSVTAARLRDGAGNTLATHGAEPDGAPDSAGALSEPDRARLLRLRDAQRDRELVVALGADAVPELVRVDALAMLSAVR